MIRAFFKGNFIAGSLKLCGRGVVNGKIQCWLKIIREESRGDHNFIKLVATYLYMA
jgi:hypothetical protein